MLRFPRFSEDLGFAGGTDFDTTHLVAIKSCLEQYLRDRYGLNVSVKAPGQAIDLSLNPEVEPDADAADQRGVKVAKWQIGIETAPERRDVPRQRIKLEVANVPAYTREIRTLTRNYDFLPAGYADTFIGVESLTEVMADKLVSLPACTCYVRNRDIWDLRWLKQSGAQLDADLIRAKLNDYGCEDYAELARSMISRLPEIISGDKFQAEMRRFIPSEVQARTLNRPEFSGFLATEVSGLLSTVLMHVDSDQAPAQERFRM